MSDFPEFEMFCPECGYIITRQQYQQARHDYGCPGCGTPFAEFLSATSLYQEEEDLDE